MSKPSYRSVDHVGQSILDRLKAKLYTEFVEHNPIPSQQRYASEVTARELHRALLQIWHGEQNQYVQRELRKYVYDVDEKCFVKIKE